MKFLNPYSTKPFLLKSLTRLRSRPTPYICRDCTSTAFSAVVYLSSSNDISYFSTFYCRSHSKKDRDSIGLVRIADISTDEFLEYTRCINIIDD
jgi:hypothetical protein